MGDLEWDAAAGGDEEEAGWPRQPEGFGEDLNSDEGESVAPEAQLHPNLPGEEADRELPVFSEEKEIEQFIQEFSDVAAVSRWPPRVTLLHLRMSTVSLRSLLSRFRHCFMLYINGFQGIAQTVFVSH